VPPAPVPSRRVRCVLALLVAVASAAMLWLKGVPSDFDQVWHGARALWRGENPYAVVGPNNAVFWPWPLYYPLPAMLAVAPLAAMPVHLARAVFIGTGAGIFTWAITENGFARLPILLSVPFLHAVQLGQWSPLIAAMFVLPGLGWLAVAKPNVGIAVAAAAPSDRTRAVALVGGGLLLLASLVVLPRWPLDWLAAIRAAPHVTAPVTRLGGPLLLLALVRWRRPEARLLLLLGCMPQTPCYYEALPLLLVARGLRETVALVLLSDVSFVLSPQTLPDAPLATATAYARLVNLFYYLPALALVLRRPNEVPIRSWLSPDQAL
jgi:hypothetical protein